MDPFKRATYLLCSQYTSTVTSAEVAVELPPLISQMAADPESQPDQPEPAPTQAQY